MCPLLGGSFNGGFFLCVLDIPISLHRKSTAGRAGICQVRPWLPLGGPLPQAARLRPAGHPDPVLPV